MTEGLSGRKFSSLVENNKTSAEADINVEHGQVIAGKYTSADPTLANGDFGFIRVDSTGQLLTSGGGTQYAEDTAHTSGDTGTMSLAVRNDTASALAGTDGDYIPLTTDAIGALWQSLATQIAGEDTNNDVLKTEQRFTYSAAVVADTLVKTGAGFLHCIRLSQDDAAPTAGSLIVYDNTAESGTVIFKHTWTTAVFQPVTVFVNANFGTGLYLGLTTTGDVSIGVSYR